MNATVAICTWNRAALLDRTLAKLRDLRVPTGLTWELLVVNNNSTDGTDAVIAKHAGSLPIRRLFEPNPGHSNARNCAVRHATGDLLIWTDDDVLADPDWLAELTKAAADYHDAAFFGGTVTPWFEVPPPRWLTRGWPRLSSFYAVRELGPTVRPFAASEQPFGANMAFRTAALRRFPFDPGLGHIGSAARGGDETDVVRRMRDAGLGGVWVGTARVEHFIPADRMTKAFLWSYARRIAAQEMAADEVEGKLWAGVPRWLLRLFAMTRLRAKWAALTGSADWADHFIRAAGVRARIDWYRARQRTEGGVTA